MREDLELSVEDAPDHSEVEGLAKALEVYNEQHWPGHQCWQPLGVFVRDGTAVAAGLAGETYAGWLFVRYLWVGEAFRGCGVGSRLMAAAERRGLERGCHSAWVDTFSFQARGFYEKLGYSTFAALPYPPGQERFFLQKRLG